MQYLVVLVPLLYAVSPRFANVYGLAAGAFLLAAYDHYSDWTFPFSSLFDSMFPVYVGIIGLAPWVLLVGFIVMTVAFGRRGERGVRRRRVRFSGRASYRSCRKSVR